MTKHSSQTAPKHLAPATQIWFDAVITAYELEPHHVRILTLAGEALDRCQQARERLAIEGLTVPGREGLKSHPCIAIERDARAAFAHLVRQLGLDDVDAPHRGPGRPGFNGIGVTLQGLNGLPERLPLKRGKRSKRCHPNIEP